MQILIFVAINTKKQLDFVRDNYATYFKYASDITFTNFLCQLLRDKGYFVEQRPTRGSSGISAIIRDSQFSYAFKIKRSESKITVNYINKVLDGKNKINCEKLFIVSTSPITLDSYKYLKSLNAIYWDYDLLLKCVAETYLDNMKIKDYFKKDKQTIEITTQTIKPEDYLKIQLEKIDFNLYLRNTSKVTGIYLRIQNISEDDIYISPYSVNLVRKYGAQINCLSLLKEHFTKGTLEAGCFLTIGLVFTNDDCSEINIGDKVVIHSNIGELQYAFVKQEDNKGCSGSFSNLFWFLIIATILYFLLK